MNDNRKPSFFEDMFLILSILMFGWPVLDNLGRGTQILILLLLGFLAAFLGLRSGFVRSALRIGLAICGLILLVLNLFLFDRLVETLGLGVFALILLFFYVAGRWLLGFFFR